MKELVVISGKGGTGKTSLTAAFASLAENRILCDADVDAADLHLLMKPDVKTRTDFKGGGIALINLEKCVECGMCRDLCRFDAISEDYIVDGIDCFSVDGQYSANVCSNRFGYRARIDGNFEEELSETCFVLDVVV